MFESGFFDMPHGDSGEWAFDRFKAKAKASGNQVTPQLIEEFQKEMAKALSQNADTMTAMLNKQEEENPDYI